MSAGKWEVNETTCDLQRTVELESSSKRENAFLISSVLFGHVVPFSQVYKYWLWKARDRSGVTSRRSTVKTKDDMAAPKGNGGYKREEREKERYGWLKQ